MAVSTIDEKWRIIIPREVREKMRLFPKMPVSIMMDSDRIVVTALRAGADRRKADSLTWLLDHPARADPRKLKSVDLDKVENQMWLP